MCVVAVMSWMWTDTVCCVSSLSVSVASLSPIPSQVVWLGVVGLLASMASACAGGSECVSCVGMWWLLPSWPFFLHVPQIQVPQERQSVEIETSVLGVLHIPQVNPIVNGAR